MEQRPAGFHRVNWDGRSDAGQRVESGVYFVRMRAGDTESGQAFVQTRKVVLLSRIPKQDIVDGF